MTPLALVTHAAAANNQQAQAAAAAAAAAAHHRLIGTNFGQVPGLVTNELEQRMIEYLKIMHSKKDNVMGGNPLATLSAVHQQQQQSFQNHQTAQQLLQAGQQQSLQTAEQLALSLQQQESRRTSIHSPPETLSPEALNALELSRVALWQMYQNNTNNSHINHSPPSMAHTPPRSSVDLNGFDGQR